MALSTSDYFPHQSMKWSAPRQSRRRSRGAASCMIPFQIPAAHPHPVVNQAIFEDAAPNARQRSLACCMGQRPPIVAVGTHARGRRYRRRLRQKIGFAFVVGVALVLLSGCISQAVITQLERTNAARKADSLNGWETARLDGFPMIETLGLRTAIVFRNFDSVSMTIDDSGFSGEGKPGGNALTGSAVPISIDGYFLTAVHCVRDAETLDLSVAVWHEDGHLSGRTMPARVVWKSEDYSDFKWDPEDPEIPLDFAVIYADVGPLKPLKLADELPRINEPIISAGWPFEHFDSFPDGAILAAGHILSVDRREPRGSSPAWVDIIHDIPLVSGDSGAPTLDRKGNLIGINIGLGITVPWLSFLRGVAMKLGRAPSDFDDFEYAAITQMPDPNWLRKVIEVDRLRRADKPRSVLEPSSGISD